MSGRFFAVLRTHLPGVVVLLTTGNLVAQNDPLPSGPPPGVVIARTPSPADRFIGSPSIVVLPNGDYLASHDWFGRGAPRPNTTDVYRSIDRGATWTRLAGVPYLHFATLFAHGGDLYLLGTSTNRSPGYISIHRSRDGGVTWTNATGAATGRLFFPPPGGAFACASTPVLVSGGRIWKAYTETPDVDLPGITGHGAMMISAPVGADLLNAANWTRTHATAFDPSWLNARRPGWQEGNAVQTPEGGVAGLFRIDAFRGDSGTACALGGGAAGIPRYEIAALVRADGVENSTFRPTATDGWVHFPGGATKFTIRHDPVSGRYWSIVNKITATATNCTTTFALAPSMQRNVLSLVSSPDLRSWTEHCRLIRWREGETITQKDRTGFQYVDWQFDGDDIVYVSRTGWAAHRAHDANYLTFHRAEGFRSLMPADAGPELATRANRFADETLLTVPAKASHPRAGSGSLVVATVGPDAGAVSSSDPAAAGSAAR